MMSDFQLLAAAVGILAVIVVFIFGALDSLIKRIAKLEKGE